MAEVKFLRAETRHGKKGGIFQISGTGLETAWRRLGASDEPIQVGGICNSRFEVWFPGAVNGSVAAIRNDLEIWATMPVGLKL